jgi:hypothetical protein
LITCLELPIIVIIIIIIPFFFLISDLILSVMDNIVKKKSANRPNRGGGAVGYKPSPAPSQVAGAGGGYSKKGDMDAMNNGFLGDVVLTPKATQEEHPR